MKQILLTILCASLLAGAAFASDCPNLNTLYGPTDGSREHVLVYYEKVKSYVPHSGYARNYVIYNDNEYGVRVWWVWPGETPRRSPRYLDYVDIEGHGCAPPVFNPQYEKDGDLQIAYVRRDLYQYRRDAGYKTRRALRFEDLLQNDRSPTRKDR